MHNPDLQRQLETLRYVQTTCAAGEADEECRAHWARYLCIMTAAFLENSFHEVYVDYLQKNGRPARDLTRVRNPTSDDFGRRINQFNHLWRDEFWNFVADLGRADAIDSITRLRHQIAHRGESNVALAQIAEYLPKCVEVIEFIEDRLVV